MKFNSAQLKKGFTLIELLVVIGILAVLLAIVLIAINPARQFGLANNTKRTNDTKQILNAIGAYMAENRGQLPAPIAALAADTPTTISDATLNICDLLVDEYIPALPTNPTLNTDDIDEAGCAAAHVTGYSVSRDANNRITVSADTTDNGAVITVTR